VAVVRKQTIPRDRPPHFGEVSANFRADVAWSAQRIPTRTLISVFLDPEPLLFHLSSFSFSLTRLSGPRSIPTTSQKIWQRRRTNPGPLNLYPGNLTTRTQRRSNVCYLVTIMFVMRVNSQNVHSNCELKHKMDITYISWYCSVHLCRKGAIE
jgi:hypothetical protein